MKNNANIQVSYCVIHAKVREGKKFKAHYLELIYIKYKKIIFVMNMFVSCQFIFITQFISVELSTNIGVHNAPLLHKYFLYIYCRHIAAVNTFRHLLSSH